MNPTVDKIILAPMEGVADAMMRDLLTSINCFDLCITEFVRVVDQKLPAHVFKRISPELNNQGYTPSGTPIRIQLLGQDPNWLAENALTAIALGSHGVDLNFGCPAKTVNKSKGGAVLLKSPEQIYRIISAVKSAMGSHTLSAKIRLGFDNTELFDEIVDAVLAGGANQLTIHARTKADGYRPPAHWHFIKPVTERANIDIIANGEIWNEADAKNCFQQSNCTSLMIGRGALSLPNITHVIKNNHAPYNDKDLFRLLLSYSDKELKGDKSFYFSSRLKQWLRYLSRNYPSAQNLFDDIKRLKDKNEIVEQISFHFNNV
ncbi:tRNA-dihydrouridine synthase [Thalassotalea fusca]